MRDGGHDASAIFPSVPNDRDIEQNQNRQSQGYKSELGDAARKQRRDPDCREQAELETTEPADESKPREEGDPAPRATESNQIAPARVSDRID